jgi:hypothetical protein
VANAVLPDKLASLMPALANLLDDHTRSLVLTDANARLERDAYAHLVREQRAIAEQLEDLAKAMRGYRDLPMGAHDEAVLGDQRSLEVFADFIRAEEELQTLLREQVEEHEVMFGEDSAPH